ncbi:MAG: PASTA domain-containing protein [Bacteroidales bacterium]|jgi:cell division protein FtsI (penicillin-binding protein 3)|nr:PASTA domain-containing protein [Bacteroidales bacterium]
MNDNKGIKQRSSLVYILLFVPCIIIIGQILYLQLWQHDKYEKEYKARFLKYAQIPIKRGNILSVDEANNDTLLFATDVLRYEMRIDLGKNKNAYVIPDSIYKGWIHTVCDSLAKILPQKTKNEYLKYFKEQRRKGNRSTLIAKDVSISQYDRIETIPYMKKFIGGAVSAKKHYIRTYPYADKMKMARRTLGILISNIGMYDGISGYYDSTILRQADSVPAQKIARGLYYKQMGNSEPADIITTIDVGLQELADYSLEKCLRENDASSGCVVLMDVDSGYVRAISNLKKDSFGNFREIENMALTQRMEPGSTFKTVSAMVLLDKGLAKITDIVPKGRRRFPNTIKEIVDDGGGKIGSFTFREAIQYSSNVGISYLVYKNYVESKNKKQFIKDLKQYFWFDSSLHLDYKFIFSSNGNSFVSEEPVAYISKNAASVDDILRLSYGYVSMITPLQMLTFYNAIANNGIMIKPMFVSHIIRTVDNKRQAIALSPDTLRINICKKETLDILQSVLKDVVEHGTAKVSKSSYGVAGKTGTSEDIKTKLNHASFVGYFPADAPKYSCIVVINATTKHGGEVAAPVFKDLADRVMGTKETFLDTTKVRTDSNTIIRNIKFGINNSAQNNQRIIEQSRTNNIMPNLIGLSAKDAVYILSALGLKSSINGYGKVVSQSVSAGTNIMTNTSNTIKLTLK